MTDRLVDACGRPITYLRLSVTDRCDLRCAYCMPPDFDDYVTQAHWLDNEELLRIVRIFSCLGVSRVRLTGGEPLLRARVCELAAEIRRLPGISDLSISTNGTTLARHAHALRQAGVDRLNVSLDTLNRERFIRIARRDALEDVLHGLDAARQAGFELIKINMVWLPHENAEELDSMIVFCRQHGFVLRLIENMPVGETARAIGSGDLRALIATMRQRHSLVDHVVPGGGPARYLASADASFSIGFITPHSQHFCDSCNRVRVGVDGELHLCLGDEHAISLGALMRGGETDDAIAANIRDALKSKPRGHSFSDTSRKIVRFMSRTGG